MYGVLLNRKSKAENFLVFIFQNVGYDYTANTVKMNAVLFLLSILEYFKNTVFHEYVAQQKISHTTEKSSLHYTVADADKCNSKESYFQNSGIECSLKYDRICSRMT
jgi:hypothetical protein